MKDFLLIDFSVGGVNHPLVTVHCRINRNTRLKLVIDGKEEELIDSAEIGTNYVQNLLADKKVIDYKCHSVINKDGKNLKLYLVDEDGIEYKIKDIDIDKSKRIGWSIKHHFKSITRKIFRVPRTIGKTIKLMWKRHHFLIPPKKFKQYVKSFLGHVGDDNIYEHFGDPLDQKEYLRWLSKQEKKTEYEQLVYRPLISVVVPVYNAGKNILSECINSVLNQSYDNLEICLADDHSTNEETVMCLREFEKKDSRVKVIYREKNGHISEATNSAISIANGEYIGLLDNDDILHKDALYEVVRVLNKDKNIDMIYTDEDKIALNGKRYFPHFKPDFSPDTLYSSNYICHFTVLRKNIVEEIGGFRGEYNGSQDYDLFLRFTEKTKNIYHIPKILYHWRMIEGSTSSDASSKNYAYEAGKRALEDSLKRRGVKGKVNLIGTPQMYDIEYEIQGNPLVSIVIPTKDKIDVLKRCLDSIYEKTDYDNFEIIVIDNNSEAPKTFKILDEFKDRYDNFSYYTYKCEFNYSYLNNEAVKKAKGDYIVLLNNDTEVITNNWLKKMLGYAMQEHVGCVGAKLLYPTDTIQHCGVVIGIAGVAAHAFVDTGLDNFGYFGRLIAAYDWSAVTAACLMVKKSKYDEVGGLDEYLKVAYNDVDFNMKILEKGYYNVVLPSVMLYHYESLSRGNDLDEKNKPRYIEEVNYISKKWGSKGLKDRFYNENLSYYYPFYFDKADQKFSFENRSKDR